MNTLREHLSQLKGRVTAVHGAARLIIGAGVLLLASSFVFVYLSATPDPAPPAVKGVARISMTRLIADAKAGRLSGAVVDEAQFVVQATYGPGAATAPAPAGAPDGGVLSAGAVVNADILASYLSSVVGTLVQAAVPVHAGSITGDALAVPGVTTAATDPLTGVTTSSAVPRAPTVTGIAPATSGSGNGFLAAALLLMLGGGVLIIAGLFINERRSRAAKEPKDEEPRDTFAMAATSAGDESRQSRAGNKAPAIEPATIPDTRFSDVAGCDEAKAELLELVMFLKEPERFTRTGATAPKGALLTGPPGTGKTLLARAVAGESGVPMFTAAGSDFVEKYVGVGAQRIRALFAAAREHERSIVFIDEVDAVARRRGGDGELAHVESESTLIALLSEMDGFHASNVIVIAATNRADMLDPAITRPGRLDRKVEVPNPDRRGREQILAVHVAGKPVEAGVDFTALARRTPGFSGAQLAALVNEACLDAVRKDLETVTAECFDHAVATIAMGRARTSALVTDHDREVTAWHESGHTLAAYLQAGADDPVQVTIIPRGPAGGVTWMSGNDDQFLPRTKAHAQLVTALAGRAAEEILLDGEFTQGAYGDLQSATELATSMATRYGMTRLGYQVRRSGSTPEKDVRDVVEELLRHAHTNATKLLGEHKTFLGAVAAELLAEETLTLADVHAIATRLGVARHAHVPVPVPPTQVSTHRPALADEVPPDTGATPPARTGASRRLQTGAGRRRPLTSAAALPVRRRRSGGPLTWGQ